jgi:hypothetical protein
MRRRPTAALSSAAHSGPVEEEDAMPIRFPTEAANDPVVAPDGTPRGRADGNRERREYSRGETRRDAPKPGKDINQPGFIHERDPKGDR